jgi:hypothetical protein
MPARDQPGPCGCTWSRPSACPRLTRCAQFRPCLGLGNDLIAVDRAHGRVAVAVETRSSALNRWRESHPLQPVTGGGSFMAFSFRCARFPLLSPNDLM